MKLKSIISLLVVCVCLSNAFANRQHHTFTLGDKDFLLDGKPFQIISGEMHFSRIPHEYWRQRLQMAHAMGLNTIATYVFWNYHEPKPGKFDFSSENRDIAEFIKIAQEEGLWVILRPGPYACAEWEFGGYPAWLLRNKEMQVRSKDSLFLSACENYLHHLGKEVASLQVTRGGPILMVQVENEYGSYGSDKEFMNRMRDMIVKAGFDVPLTTADGSSQCHNGCLPGVLPGLDGEYNAKAARDTINKYHGGKGPYYISEFYPGWLDNWGLKHSLVPFADFGSEYENLLKEGLSVNLYMVHGGTNFGFMNGANYTNESPIEPQPASYDYDAPIDEAGRATPKFYQLRDVIRRYLPADVVIPAVPPENKVIRIPPVKLESSANLFSLPGKAVISDYPLSMEDLDQSYGYVLYRTKVKGGTREVLKINGLCDFAVVYVNDKRVAVLDRRLGEDTLYLYTPPESTLSILVENLGRINYGKELTDNRKGILGRVFYGGQELKGWENYSLPFDDITDIKYNNVVKERMACMKKGSFSLEETGDAFLDMRGWGKGCVWVNGHNLGRYWYIGPQQTLYLPGCWLKKGNNEIVLFEMLGNRQDVVKTSPVPLLNDLRNQKVTISGRYNKQKEEEFISMHTNDSISEIYYVMDNLWQTAKINIYQGEFSMNWKSTILARASLEGYSASRPARVDVVPSYTSGRNIKLTYPYSPRYPSAGDQTLADAFRGSNDFHDGFWQGYEANDLEAVIDMDSLRTLKSISAGFLQDIDAWIFLPMYLEFAISENGTDYFPLGKVVNDVSMMKEGAFRKDFSLALTGQKARFVKVFAKNMRTCPPNHVGHGQKAWIFADEIVVE